MSTNDSPEGKPSDKTDAQPYETKTVRVHLPERGQRVFLMLTRFDGADHLLGADGWGGEYVRYGIVSRNPEAEDAVTGDPFQFIRLNDWLRDTPAETFVKDLEMGRFEWSDFEDGERLSRPDVLQLAGREEPEQQTQEAETDD